jgi:hypothetical protein
MKHRISLTLAILFIVAGLCSTAHSQDAGTVDFIAASGQNYLYRVLWNSGTVRQWTYIGGGIADARVSPTSEAFANGWEVIGPVTSTEVTFGALDGTDTPLTDADADGFVGGFVIEGSPASFRDIGQWICHDFFGPVDGPLSVELSRFTAYYDAPKFQVALKWSTQSEINNLGFDVYRSESLDGPFVKVSQTYIPGAGTDGTPHSYRFIDENVEVGKTYYYYLEDISYNGVRGHSHVIRVKVDPTGKLKVVGLTPSKFALLQNFPNPFNPETWIPYQLPQDASVIVRIYNFKGQPIRTIELGQQTAGTYLTKDRAVYWDGRDHIGEKVASGVYFYTLQAGDFSATKRMVIVE